MIQKILLQTKGFTDIINLTPYLEEFIEEKRIKNGIGIVFCPGSTAGITTLEYETGLISDLKEWLEKIIPAHSNYKHCQRWGDCNGYAHLRSALIKPSFGFIIENGRPLLGTWQQVVLIDFDNRPRQREIIIKILTENKDDK